MGDFKGKYDLSNDNDNMAAHTTSISGIDRSHDKSDKSHDRAPRDKSPEHAPTDEYELLRQKLRACRKKMQEKLA